MTDQESISVSVVDLSQMENDFENVQPLRGGRDVRRAVEGLGHSQLSQLSAESQNEHAKLQMAVQQAMRGSDGGVALAAWKALLRWSEQMFPSQRERVCRPLYEEATNLLAETFVAARGIKAGVGLAQNIDYLRLWIQRCAYVREGAQDMFAALHAQTIGTTHALLYEAWANVAEKRKDYVEALRIFDMGIGCGADPLPRLKKNRKRFTERNRERLERQRRKQQEEHDRNRTALRPTASSSTRSSSSSAQPSSVQAGASSLVFVDDEFADDTIAPAPAPAVAIQSAEEGAARVIGFPSEEQRVRENQPPTEAWGGHVFPQHCSTAPSATYDVYEDAFDQKKKKRHSSRRPAPTVDVLNASVVHAPDGRLWSLEEGRAHYGGYHAKTVAALEEEHRRHIAEEEETKRRKQVEEEERLRNEAEEEERLRREAEEEERLRQEAALKAKEEAKQQEVERQIEMEMERELAMEMEQRNSDVLHDTDSSPLGDCEGFGYDENESFSLHAPLRNDQCVYEEDAFTLDMQKTLALEGQSEVTTTHLAHSSLRNSATVTRELRGNRLLEGVADIFEQTLQIAGNNSTEKQDEDEDYGDDSSDWDTQQVLGAGFVREKEAEKEESGLCSRRPETRSGGMVFEVFEDFDDDCDTTVLRDSDIRRDDDTVACPPQRENEDENENDVVLLEDHENSCPAPSVPARTVLSRRPFRPLSLLPSTTAACVETEQDEKENVVVLRDGSVSPLRRSMEEMRFVLDQKKDAILRTIDSTSASPTATELHRADATCTRAREDDFVVYEEEEESDDEAATSAAQQPNTPAPWQELLWDEDEEEGLREVYPHTERHQRQLETHPLVVAAVAAPSAAVHDKAAPESLAPLLRRVVSASTQVGDVCAELLPGLAVTVRRFVAEGANARVFAVEVCPSSTAATSRYDGGDEEDDSTAVITRMPPQMAMKLTTAPPPSHSVVWEFYVQQQLHARLGGVEWCHKADARRFDCASAAVQWRDHAALLSPLCASGSLHDAIVACQKHMSGGARRQRSAEAAEGCDPALGRMDTTVALFFTFEMLRMVRTLHLAGIVHCDVKPDNFLLLDDADEGKEEVCRERLLTCATGEWEQWRSDGAAKGWRGRGLRLIDFGRAIDLTLYECDNSNEHEVLCFGPSATDGFGRPCMHNNGLPQQQLKHADSRDIGWREDIDLCGVAGTLHVMVFNSYMRVEQRGNEAHLVLESGQSFPALPRGAKDVLPRLFHLLLNSRGREGAVVEECLQLVAPLLEKNGRKLKLALVKLKEVLMMDK